MALSFLSEPLLAVIGPTAAGKTAWAMQEAMRINGEIVSCDSVLVYKHFHIGCAKPTPQECAQVPHHVIDCVEWFEPYHAQQYCDDAIAAMRDIVQRGKTPILCGGTGLYLRALRYGLMPTPPSDPDIRQHYEALEAKEPGILSRLLQERDPQEALSIDLKNPVRLVRALEIIDLTGTTITQLKQEHGFQAPRFNMRFHLIDAPDDVLQQRIQMRVQQMLEQGLIEEVQALLKQGVSPECRPMRSVGYAEVCAVLSGNMAFSELVEAMCRATWQLARRQRVWFRKELRE